MLDDIRALAAYDVVLASGSAEATGLSRELALSGGALSCFVGSAADWVERLWELAGDGRGFVDRTTRVVAMGIALEGKEGLEGPHLAALLSQRMRDAAGTPELDAALRAVRAGEAPSGLLPSETEVLRALADYEDALAELGLIEEGSACAYLGAHLAEAFPRRRRVALVGARPLSPQLEAFLEKAEAAGFVEIDRFGQDGGELCPPAEGIALRFAFPSGRYATPQLALKVASELRGNGPILVSCKKPVELYRALEPALAARGMSVAVRGSVPLAATLLGRLTIALSRALENGAPPWDKAALSDALANPLLRASLGPRMQFDARLRENLLLEGADALAALPDSASLSELGAFVREPSDKTLAAARAALAGCTALSGAERAELFAASDVYEAALAAAERLGRGLGSLGELLAGPLSSCSIPVRCANAELSPGECADVLIEGMGQAAAEPKGRFATVLVLDLDADSYPAAQKAGAIDLLLGRLGVPAPERPIERQRRELAACARLPMRTLILGRCLANAKADPTYPAAVLEEFVDLFRADTTLADDIDNMYALPESLQAGLISCGEDALEADVWPGIAPQRTYPAEESPKAALFEHAPSADGPALTLSPAQIEAYLDCPAKWFLGRKLATGALDEEMGARELGIYRHDVLQEFYKAFQASGEAKVSADNRSLAEATLRRVMDEVYGSYLALDANGRPVRALDRCVAIPKSSDARTLKRVREELVEWLGFEEAFLPGPATGEGASPSAYAPRAFELSLDGFDVRFAGARLKGRIDRVDVSLDGSNFVVVDYKGGVGPTHSPVLEDGALVLPCKIQALIYAAAIARTPALQEALGLTRGGAEAIAGAVYVSYLRGHAIRGSFTEALTRERHLPTLPAKAEPLSSEDMAALIDEVERVVAERVVGPMRAGAVEPLPLKGACDYCPAQACARRGWTNVS